ncbi:pseudouridine synthase [Hypoxylon cercidicola]|nr:pseudouridine synthase [Hypoxylon cercidicola]
MDNKKTHYEKWTKNELIKRIQTLEAGILRSGEQKQEEASHQLIADGASTEDAVASPPPKKKKVERKLDPSKYSTRLVAFKLAYLGKRYGGFEFAEHANLPSIEEELWKAFVKACLIFPETPEEVNWDAWEYSKCGRTDRGVSAFGQVITVRVRSNRPLPKKEPAVTEGQGSPDGNEPGQDTTTASPVKEVREFDDFTDELPYCRILNRLLPPDIRILAWCPKTPAEFSARHDCRERQYRYFFTQPAFAPLPRDLENPETATTTKVKGGWLDIDAMQRAAKKFEGLHDFRNFCKVDPGKLNINFERRVFESEIVEVKDAETALPYLARDEFRPPSTSNYGLGEASQKLPKVYYFHVRGTAFLWHQIRCMVSVIFMVGQGLEDPSIIDRLLDIEVEPKKPNYQLADEIPLVLWDCVFPRDEKPENALEWVYLGEENPQNQHGITGLLSQMWEYWRERKMDELLSSQLLNLVSAQADITLRRDPRAPPHVPVTTRTFEGGNKERLVGKYQPMLQKKRLPSPQEVFDREAKRKGYADAAEMREALAKKRAEAIAAAENPPAEVVSLEEEAE